LLFATLLAELLFVLCLVLVAVLVMKVFVNEEQLKRARLANG
jgi:flagellar biogenesis protein FliO